MTLLDPRPLEPPLDWGNDPEPDLAPYWHLIATDGHEDYALSPTEVDDLTAAYLAAGVPFTIRQVLCA